MEPALPCYLDNATATCALPKKTCRNPVRTVSTLQYLYSRLFLPSSITHRPAQKQHLNEYLEPGCPVRHLSPSPKPKPQSLVRPFVSRYGLALIARLAGPRPSLFLFTRHPCLFSANRLPQDRPEICPQPATFQPPLVRPIHSACPALSRRDAPQRYTSWGSRWRGATTSGSSSCSDCRDRASKSYPHSPFSSSSTFSHPTTAPYAPPFGSNTRLSTTISSTSSRAMHGCSRTRNTQLTPTAMLASSSRRASALATVCPSFSLRWGTKP